MVIEDIAVPVARLADAVGDLQGLFSRHGYAEAVIFGHAKDGNLHFVVTPSFNDQDSARRYQRLMDDVVSLVVDKYDGALKAEHGAGRNMAPFVEREWGSSAYGIMRELKHLLDPDGLLNPGVIINADPHAHLRDVKRLPRIESEVDRCIECGYCEPVCPSRRLTTTPRQRIVVRREVARLTESGADPAMLRALNASFAYDALDTCATDGLCARACPVDIDTGALVKRLRAQTHTAPALARADWVRTHFAVLERLLRIGLRLGHLATKIAGPGALVALTKVSEWLLRVRLPKWNRAMPYASLGKLPITSPQTPQAVYFPACLSRVMGRPPLVPTEPALTETLLTISRRAGVELWIPDDCAGHCCGMPFGSKGYTGAYHAMLRRTIERMWHWSRAGALPIVIDASSCAYTLRSCAHDLDGLDLDRWRGLKILDSVEFICDVLLPRLKPVPCALAVVLHPNCACRKLGGQEKLIAIARTCAREVVVPANLDCCGFAGDRGLLIPELAAAATEKEAAEVNARGYDGYYSSNLTCEMGVSLATGKPYRSIAYLVEEATRAT